MTMKEMTKMLTAIAVAAVWALPSYGQSRSSIQPAVGQSPTTKPAAPSGYVYIAGAGNGTYQDLFKVCELTAEQQKKILDLEARKAKVIDENKAATKAAQDAMTKAQADKDHDALTKAIAQYQAVVKPAWEAQQKAQAELAAVLTPEQKAKWQEYTILNYVKQWQKGVKFTDAQWDKIIEAYEKLAKDSKVQSWQITMKLNAIIDGILTPEQKAKKLLATKYALMNQSVHFTDEQVKKMVKIEDERAKELAELQANNAARQSELQQAAQEAYKSGDKDALAAVQTGFVDLNKTYTDLGKKFDDHVQATLTDTQKTAWQEVQKNNPYWQWNGGGGGWVAGGGGAAPGGQVPMTPKNPSRSGT
jgi:Spy/CpxP family protein refolding chaperone